MAAKTRSPHLLFNMKLTIITLQDLLYQLQVSPVGEAYVANWLELRTIFGDNWKDVGGI